MANRFEFRKPHIPSNYNLTGLIKSSAICKVSQPEEIFSFPNSRSKQRQIIELIKHHLQYYICKEKAKKIRNVLGILKIITQYF
jgi:hypothetical protein